MFSQVLDYRMGPASYTWKINPELAKQQQEEADQHNAAIRKKMEDEAKRVNSGALRKSAAWKHYQESAKAASVIQEKLTEQRTLVSTTVRRMQEVRQMEMDNDSKDIERFLDLQLEVNQLTQQLIVQKNDLKEFEQQHAAAQQVQQEAKKKLKQEYVRLIEPLARKIEEALQVAEAANQEIRFLSEQAHGLDFAAPMQAGRFGSKFADARKYFDGWASR